MQGKVTRTAKKSGAISNLAEFGGGRTQKEVDDLKQALAEATKEREDLKKKLAENERALPPATTSALPPYLPPATTSAPAVPPGPTQKEVDALKQALAEALKDKEDSKKKLAEKERSVEEFKFHLDEAQQFIDDMMDKEDPQKKLARPARSGAPSALSQPRSHAPSAQSEVDEEKEKSQKALGLPSLPPRAQLTMILDLDFASTGAEGMTMKCDLK